MKNITLWKPTKYVLHRGRLRGSRDPRDLAVGSRLMGDLIASHYQAHLPTHAHGLLLDLGCGSVPLHAAYAPFVAEVTCVDWAPGEHIDFACDLASPLPFAAAAFDTVILSDVLEHVPDPDLLWREIARVLAPGGVLLMNVPFYYAVHAHPHDYYRYTRFALERFIARHGLELVQLEAIGGIVEVMCDLHAKALSKLRLVGPPLAMLLQWLVVRFGNTRLGARTARVSSRHFPFGYFLIARQPGGGAP